MTTPTAEAERQITDSQAASKSMQSSVFKSRECIADSRELLAKVDALIERGVALTTKLRSLRTWPGPTS